MFIHFHGQHIFHSFNSIKWKFYLTNTKIVVAWDRKTIEVWKTTDGRKICEIKELEEDERISWQLTSCCITGDQMAVLSQNVGQEKLSLWDVSVPSEVTRLKS